MSWRWGLAGAYAVTLIGSYAVQQVPAASTLPAGMSAVTLNAVDEERRLPQPVRLAYREYGTGASGTPLLVLHGSPGSSDTFNGLAPLLADRRLVLAPDLPGFGSSSVQIPDYSFRAHAVYVRDLLDARGIGQVHLLGFSMGGGVALSFADRNPDRVASLTMLSAIGLQEMELLGEYHINHAIHGVQLAGLWFLSRAVPHNGVLNGPLPYARNFFDSDQRPLEAALRRIQAPTLIVHGRVDPLVPIEAALEHARLVPHSQLHIVVDDHFMVIEHPERVAGVIAAFLSRADRGEAPTRADADAARVRAALRPLDRRIVPRANAVNAAVLGAALAAASAASPIVAAIASGVLVAQSRAGASLAFVSCALGALVASIRRRSPVASARRVGATIAGVAIGAGAGSVLMPMSLLASAGAWTRAAAMTAVIVAAVWVGALCASHRRRRLAVSSWLRLTHWEYWPPWITYAPVAAYVIWLMLKHRHPTAFTASNPAIPASGFIGESKIDILRGLGASGDRVARSGLIDGRLSVEAKIARAEHVMRALALDLPVVLKPNEGQRGSGVVVVRTRQELIAYFQRSCGDVIVQEYVPGFEFGVFYVRRPSAPRGRILSITDKRLPTVVGDGRRTLERLILSDRRTLGMARFHLARHREGLGEIPAGGQVVSLGDCASHCRGATFLDTRRLLTPDIEHAFDAVARQYEGFYFGRFDVRVSSLEQFAAGRGFKIIELNGVTSEATHIYDPDVSVIDAYRALFEQWRLAFEIGAVNIARGAMVTSVSELVRLVACYRESSVARASAGFSSRRYNV